MPLSPWSTRRDLRAFPDEARADAGRALSRVQRGGDPPSWKPMPAVGPGSRELRISTVAGGRLEHRVFYVALAFRKERKGPDGR